MFLFFSISALISSSSGKSIVSSPRKKVTRDADKEEKIDFGISYKKSYPE